MDNQIPNEIMFTLRNYTDSIILKMTPYEIMDWLDEEDRSTIEMYLRRYERMEYYEVCVILRDYLLLYE
tara:strand:- start:1646 stop:1852 length:207 start_codon:yes stop_codon:yes gene_type:complete